MPKEKSIKNCFARQTSSAFGVEKGQEFYDNTQG